MKYSKKDRELAILICDLAASTDVHIGEPWHVGAIGPAYANFARELGLETGLRRGEISSALFLALKAFGYVGGGWSRAADAEAAQILREGWSP